MSETTGTPVNPAPGVTLDAARPARSGPAKYLKPRALGNSVRRQRLLDLLDSRRDAQLILIVAQAGYGKSNLISNWLSESHIRHAWLFADEHDADPATFMRSLIESVARSEPDLIPTTLELLAQPTPPYHQLLSEFVEELSEAPAPFMLVVDDYHRAQSPEIDALLGMLLRSFGATPSLVLISRTRPHLPLDVLNVYGEMVELDAASLRFSPDEARALVRQSSPASVTPEMVEAIVDRAGGWAVGLRLLTASTELVDALPGANVNGGGLGPEIANYLFAEVVAHQPKRMQDFLQRTAVLEFLQPESCDQLTGRHDSRQVLDLLSANNLFTELVNREDRSYRYHPLFRDALLDRLHTTLDKPQIDGLYRVAARQYEDAGELERATNYWMIAGDWDRALDLVHRQAPAWMLEDQLTVLETWTGQFPLDLLLRDSFLTFCRLWALVRLGRIAQAETLLAPARERAERDDDAYFSLRLDLIESYIGVLRYDAQITLDYCQRWLTPFPRAGTFEHLAFLMFQTLAEMFAGRPEAAVAALAQTREMVESTGKPWIDCLESAFRGRMLTQQGQNAKAKSALKQAIYLGERANAQPVHYSHLLMAQACVESMELRSARSNALRCLDLADTIGMTVHISPALQLLADVAMVRGDRHESEQHIRQAIRVARQNDFTGQLMDAEARQAHYLISSGDVEGAASWAESRLRLTRRPQDFQQYQENAVLARYLSATGRTAEAEALLAPMFDEARTRGRRRDECEIAMLLALSRWCAGDEQGALAKFRPALRRAAEHQWIFALAQDIQLFSPMLERIEGDRELSTFVNSLLRDRRDRQHTRVVLDSTGTPLTPRERDMLSGLLTGKSNRELADEMFISEYTVKRHLSNLYTKLGVSSRAQAISYFANRATG